LENEISTISQRSDSPTINPPFFSYYKKKNCDKLGKD
jgi:hypothetical protein